MEEDRLQAARQGFDRVDKKQLKSTYEFIKCLLVFMTLGLIRIILVIIILSTYILYIRLFALIKGCSIDEIQALGEKERRIFGYGRYPTRFLLKVIGFKITFEGDPSLCDKEGHEARLIVADHVSMVDILAIYGYGGDVYIPSFISKVGVLSAPFVGTLLRSCRGIAVNRSKSGSGTSGEIIRRAKSLNEPPVAIFPEGTTTNGTVVASFHKSAFLAGEPIKVIAIQYPWKHFSEAYDIIYFGPYAFRFFGQVYHEMKITYLPLYVPSEEEKKDPSLFCENVRSLLAKTLGVPMVDINFKDKVLLMEEIYNTKDIKDE